MQLQAFRIPVLQGVQVFDEHRRRLLAIAIKQQESTIRLMLPTRLDHRQNRRNPAACRKSDVVVRICRIENYVKLAGRWHRVERIADGKLIGGELRKLSAGLHADAYLQRRLALRRAYAVGAAQLFAIDRYLKRQVLARQKCVLAREFIGHAQRDADRVVGLAIESFNRQSGETVSFRCT